MLSLSVHMPDLENIMHEVHSLFLLTCQVLCSDMVLVAFPMPGITYLTFETVIIYLTHTKKKAGWGGERENKILILLLNSIDNKTDSTVLHICSVLKRNICMTLQI